MSGPLTLDALNALDATGFVARFGGVLERSPDLVEALSRQRPFASAADLFGKLAAALATLSETEQDRLLNAHPELAGPGVAAGALTGESAREQAAAGLGQLSPDEAAALAEGNAAYRARFGFPFIICARRNTCAAILGTLAARLHNSREMERANALAQVLEIARLRIADLLA
jgi:2-oxo-4-hydroxy-4-carboxy-5-ureidoimidazoline decarboxylase